MRASPIPVLLILVAACTQLAEAPADRRAAVAVEGYYAAQVVPSSSAGLQTIAAASDSAVGYAAKTMLIRTARVTLEVDSLDAAISLARQVVSRVGGYAAGYDRNRAVSWRPQASMRLRVPADQLDAAVTALQALGRAELVQLSAEDVTEEFVDVTARLVNARKLERRLLDLLSARTGKLSDVVEVEEKLAAVRESIERIEGRRRYLSTRSALSDIELSLHQKGIPERAPVWGAASVAFGQAWRNFTSLIAFLIAAAGLIVPLAILALAGWVIVRRLPGRQATPLATIGGIRSSPE